VRIRWLHEIGKQQEPVDYCGIDNTVSPMLRCGKAVGQERKWPERAVSSAFRPHQKSIPYAGFTCVA
jgi:hypothetical protein